MLNFFIKDSSVFFFLCIYSLLLLHTHERIFNNYFIEQMNTVLWESISEAAKDLLKRMLITDPNKRITVQEILNHRWLRVKLSKFIFLFN